MRSLVLSRTLVFTAVNANLQPLSEGPPALQPAIFHMRPGSRIVLENVTIQTRCSSLTYYWVNLLGQLPSVSWVSGGRTAPARAAGIGA